MDNDDIYPSPCVCGKRVERLYYKYKVWIDQGMDPADFFKNNGIIRKCCKEALMYPPRISQAILDYNPRVVSGEVRPSTMGTPIEHSSNISSLTFSSYSELPHGSSVSKPASIFGGFFGPSVGEQTRSYQEKKVETRETLPVVAPPSSSIFGLASLSGMSGLSSFTPASSFTPILQPSLGLPSFISSMSQMNIEDITLGEKITEPIFEKPYGTIFKDEDRDNRPLPIFPRAPRDEMDDTLLVSRYTEMLNEMREDITRSLANTEEEYRVSQDPSLLSEIDALKRIKFIADNNNVYISNRVLKAYLDEMYDRATYPGIGEVELYQMGVKNGYIIPVPNILLPAIIGVRLPFTVKQRGESTLVEGGKRYDLPSHILDMMSRQDEILISYYGNDEEALTKEIRRMMMSTVYSISPLNKVDRGLKYKGSMSERYGTPAIRVNANGEPIMNPVGGGYSVPSVSSWMKT